MAPLLLPCCCPCARTDRCTRRGRRCRPWQTRGWPPAPTRCRCAPPASARSAAAQGPTAVSCGPRSRSAAAGPRHPAGARCRGRGAGDAPGDGGCFRGQGAGDHQPQLHPATAAPLPGLSAAGSQRAPYDTPRTCVPRVSTMPLRPSTLPPPPPTHTPDVVCVALEVHHRLAAAHVHHSGGALPGGGGRRRVGWWWWWGCVGGGWVRGVGWGGTAMVCRTPVGSVGAAAAAAAAAAHNCRVHRSQGWGRHRPCAPPRGAPGWILWRAGCRQRSLKWRRQTLGAPLLQRRRTAGSAGGEGGWGGDARRWSSTERRPACKTDSQAPRLPCMHAGRSSCCCCGGGGATGVASRAAQGWRTLPCRVCSPTRRPP